MTPYIEIRPREPAEAQRFADRKAPAMQCTPGGTQNRQFVFIRKP